MENYYHPQLSAAEVEFLLRGDGQAAGNNLSHGRVPPQGGAAPELPRDLPEYELTTVYEFVSQLMTKSLAELFPGDVVVRLVGIEQSLWGDFKQGLTDPSVLHVVTSEELGGSLLVSMTMGESFAFVDRMLNVRQPAVTVDRLPTEIEMQLLGRFVLRINDAIETSWRPTLPVHTSIEQIEFEPSRVRLTRPEETVTVATIQIDTGAGTGDVQIAMDTALVRRLETQLVAQSYAIESGAADVRSQIIVSLAELEVPASEIDGWKVGDVIVTDTPANAVANVFLDDEWIGTGRVGGHNGNKACRLESVSVSAAAKPPSS